MIPNTVKIGWRTYAIQQGEHRAGSNGGDLYGEIAYEKNTIYIYDKIPEEEKAVTLLHEILHGILWKMGSKLREDEDFITALAENLYQVFVDNPKLF